MAGETSIKGAIQSLIPDGLGIQEGTVIKVNPLNVQLTNDSAMILNQNVLLVPTHLTDYKAEIDIVLGDEGTVESSTKEGQGLHGHGPSGQHSQSEGSGEHSHPATEGEHIHELDTFSITKGTITVHNSLKKGEKVYLLSLNKGAKYYILDRVVSS